MIRFAAICPHPPLLIPGIGTKKDHQIIGKTIASMDKLAEDFEKADIDTIIVISPHNIQFSNRISLQDFDRYTGDFKHFGKPEIKMDFKSDQILIDTISKQCTEEGIPNIKYNDGKNIGELDHGTMVPLWYITKYVGNKCRLVIITYSDLDKSTHIKFGEILAKVCNTFENENIAIIASGDMSHRLFDTSDNKNNDGKLFDEMIVKDLQNSDLNSIIYYDESMIEAAGECGYRSILIMIGVLNNLPHSCEVLSYEGPYGVGYLVANFKINNLH